MQEGWEAKEKLLSSFQWLLPAWNQSRLFVPQFPHMQDRTCMERCCKCSYDPNRSLLKAWCSLLDLSYLLMESLKQLLSFGPNSFTETPARTQLCARSSNTKYFYKKKPTEKLLHLLGLCTVLALWVNQPGPELFFGLEANWSPPDISALKLISRIAVGLAHLLQHWRFNCLGSCFGAWMTSVDIACQIIDSTKSNTFWMMYFSTEDNSVFPSALF